MGGTIGGEAAASARALELAYRYLARRERTVHELREYLARRDVDPLASAAAVDELTAAGYLDDVRYARMFAHDKRHLEQWGSGRIRRTLLARGIERDLVEGALAEDGGELTRALELLERRFPEPPSDRRERQRALGALLRRGYEPELAFEALARYGHRRG